MKPSLHEPAEANESALPATLAGLIYEGYRTYRRRFDEVTRGAKERFRKAAWREGQQAGALRMDLYEIATDSVGQAIRARAVDASLGPALWRLVKHHYIRLIAACPDREIAETFFNSIYRAVSRDGDIDDTQMFVWSEFDSPPQGDRAPIARTHTLSDDPVTSLKAALKSYDFGLPWQDLDRDVRNVLRSLREERPEIESSSELALHMLSPVFYRNKGAYVVARIEYRDRAWPLVLPVLIDDDGTVYVDTMICSEDEVSVVFSFTRSYFMVDVEHPYALVEFLQGLLPGKKRSELYTCIGFPKHGKTEFYRGFLTHLARSDDLFVTAPGVKGMVMTVFTLPSYQTAFKVIKDTFAPQKNTTRQEVKEKYRIVKAHDRVGRMADTEEFDRLALPRARFSEQLLTELLETAASSVSLTPDLVIIDHVYTERLMTPLNLYIETADATALREALDEYGNAIKQLAAANIFPGDMLLKNFGVTRHGRVVFYDYDEICYLTEVNFRELPQPNTPEQELASEPWYTVGANDVFPEELRRFLFGRPAIKQVFMELHGELFEPAYWNELKRAIRDGQVMDVFPYRRKKRFMRRRRPTVLRQRA